MSNCRGRDCEPAARDPPGLRPSWRVLHIRDVFHHPREIVKSLVDARAHLLHPRLDRMHVITEPLQGLLHVSLRGLHLLHIRPHVGRHLRDKPADEARHVLLHVLLDYFLLFLCPLRFVEATRIVGYRRLLRHPRLARMCPSLRCARWSHEVRQRELLFHRFGNASGDRRNGRGGDAGRLEPKWLEPKGIKINTKRDSEEKGEHQVR